MVTLTLALLLYICMVNNLDGHIWISRANVSSPPDRVYPRGVECPMSGEARLPEIRQVVFAKVHKAASSTVQNVLLRFAMARNLSVLLPSRMSVISQKSAVIHREKVIPHPEGHAMFDILCSHVLYDRQELAKYFPDSATRVAMIREPTSQALSALTYYTTKFPSSYLRGGFEKYPQDPINGYLLHPEDFSPPNSPPGRATSAVQSYIDNRMSIDLGIDLYDFQESKKNKSKTQAFLKALEKEFDLVLISDYFEESMILLRRYLRWPMKDVVFLKVNTKQQNHADPVWNRKPNLNATAYSNFRRWNAYDYELYDHFLPIFLEKIHAESLFQEEVKTFKKIVKDVTAFCTHVNATTQPLQVPAGNWNDAFTVSEVECQLMAMPERAITRIARKRQLRRREEFLRHSETRRLH